MKHIHHIVPKHMGGNDDRENLVELSIEEHADAHRVLFEQYGNWQDLVAWKGLLGLLTSDECSFIAIKEGGRDGNKKRWGNTIKFYDDPEFIPYYKRQSGYDVGVDGRKTRTKRFWFNDGSTEGQFSLTDHPTGWIRGRLKSVMRKTNPYVSL